MHKQVEIEMALFHVHESVLCGCIACSRTQFRLMKGKRSEFCQS